MSIEEFYSREELLDHAKHPHNKGSISDASFSVQEVNSLCGDKIEITASESDHVLEEIKFEGAGCFISQAAASLVTDHVRGKKIEDVLEMGEKEIKEILGGSLTPARLKCALLPLQTIQKGIKEYLAKKS